MNLFNRKKEPKLIEGLTDPMSHVRKAPSHVRKAPYDWAVDAPDLAPEHDAAYNKAQQATVEQQSNVINIADYAGKTALEGTKQDFVRADGTIDPSVVNHIQELPPELQNTSE